MYLRVLARAASIAILAALMLTSCSSDPEAAPPPDPSPTETVVSESPEPSESAAPEAETAEEFIRRWPVVETAMLNSGDEDPYRSITLGACKSCDGLVGRVSGIYGNGGYIETDGWSILSIKAVPGDSKTERVFVVRTRAEPTKYRESEGGRVRRLNGGPINYQVTVRSNGEIWQILDAVDLGTG